ncbi:MAG: Ser-Thr-rich GPI-anchored membrane family protein [Bacteroidota bacterium]
MKNFKLLIYFFILITLTFCTKEDDNNANSSIKIVSPNGSENYQISDNIDIQWIDSISDNVKIDLYRDEIFEIEISGSTESDGSYNWSIPSSIPGNSKYKIKISSISDNKIYDFSDNNFTINTISNSYITISVPNGGEIWAKGQNHTITWNSYLTSSVKIKLYYNGVLEAEIPGEYTGNSASVNFDTYVISGTGDKYKIRVESVSDQNIFDESDNYFTLTNSTS